MRYHLGWFLNVGAQGSVGSPGWNPKIDGAWAGQVARDAKGVRIYTDLASSLELAGFDFILFQDNYHIPDSFKSSIEHTLKRGIIIPKWDPMPLIPLMGAQTRHIGFVPSMSSTFYPPYLAARLMATMDTVTEGRFGYNLITSLYERTYQNFGIDQMPPKDVRYEMASEWIDVVQKLHGSWEPDAIIADRESETFVDHTRVHRLDHVGKYFKCRGPLNTPAGPQGKNIPLIEAGNSPAGRDLAARYADAIMSNIANVPGMKAFREDMHARLAVYGRDPANFKVLYLLVPILGSTDEEAEARANAIKAARWSIDGVEMMQFMLSELTGVDMDRFGLDMTLREFRLELQKPEIAAQVGAIDALLAGGDDAKTLREFYAEKNPISPFLTLVGSPATVAAKMDEIMEEVGGDGFLIFLPATRVGVAEVCDGLAPELRQRGSIRDGFEQQKTLRENLLTF